MRKELKKKKRIRLHNKKLVKKYPWLRPCDWYGNPLKKLDYTFTWFDDIERGWAKAFGMMMIEEIDAVLRKAHYERKYQIAQIKEKYGRLTWYDNGAPHEIFEELHRVIAKYEYLSENICAACGTVDVYMTYSGWNYPLCKSCWEKHINDNRSYEEVINTDNDDGCMGNFYTVRRFNQNNEREEVTYDISDTAERIRKRYEKRSERSARRLQRLGQ